MMSTESRDLSYTCRTSTPHVPQPSKLEMIQTVYQAIRDAGVQLATRSTYTGFRSHLTRGHKPIRVPLVSVKRVAPPTSAVESEECLAVDSRGLSSRGWSPTLTSLLLNLGLRRTRPRGKCDGGKGVGMWSCFLTHDR